MSGIWVMCEKGSVNTPETKIWGHEWAREMTEGCEKWQSDGGSGIDGGLWQKKKSTSRFPAACRS